MKIGDVIESTVNRPGDRATIIKVDIHKGFDEKAGREFVSTTYTAQYKDKSKFLFYGSQVNKNVFKVQEADGQMTIFDILGGIE